MSCLYHKKNGQPQPKTFTCFSGRKLTEWYSVTNDALFGENEIKGEDWLR